VSLPKINLPNIYHQTSFVSGHLCNSLVIKKQFSSGEFSLIKERKQAVVTFSNISGNGHWIYNFCQLGPVESEKPVGMSVGFLGQQFIDLGPTG
jgi:hypothetical protein